MNIYSRDAPCQFIFLQQKGLVMKKYSLLLTGKIRENSSMLPLDLSDG
jgi:hypothetical protein